MQNKLDPPLDQFVSDAFLRFDANLRASLPKTAPRLREYLRGAPTHPEHVLVARAFPHLVLPYWLSPARKRAVDTEFQTDLIYSTLNGSYSIRLCDNIADNDSPSELRRFAPCAAYFDVEFIRPYMKHFPEGHEFWSLFDKFWAQQAEASAADSLLDDVDEETFASLSSKKFTATKIPISAVRFRYPELELLFEEWLRFVDCLGHFAQFNNDFFDWHHDSRYGITTYISCEAKRRAPGDSVAEWFLREGFDWGVAELKSRLDYVRLRAETLGNEAVLDWVIARSHTLDSDIAKVSSYCELAKTFGRITSAQQS